LFQTFCFFPLLPPRGFGGLSPFSPRGPLSTKREAVPPPRPAQSGFQRVTPSVYGPLAPFVSLQSLHHQSSSPLLQPHFHQRDDSSPPKPRLRSYRRFLLTPNYSDLSFFLYLGHLPFPIYFFPPLKGLFDNLAWETPPVVGLAEQPFQGLATPSLTSVTPPNPAGSHTSLRRASPTNILRCLHQPRWACPPPPPPPPSLDEFPFFAI